MSRKQGETRGRKAGQKVGEYSIRYFPLCLWCGAEFVAKRPDAKTCSATHRTALTRYVRKHGQPPMFPFGLKPDPKPRCRPKTTR